eukprot:403366982
MKKLQQVFFNPLKQYQAAEEEEKVPNVPGSSQNPVGTQAKIQGQSKESETKVPGKYEILNEIAKGQNEIVAGLKTLGSNIQKVLINWAQGKKPEVREDLKGKYNSKLHRLHR